ncbi:hypothetical protein ACS0TY_006150 [Phlomoides rotata]
MWMSSFLLPPTLVDELQKMLNSFWWGNSGEPQKGIKWATWDKLCVRKDKGEWDFGISICSILQCLGRSVGNSKLCLEERLFIARYFEKGITMENMRWVVYQGMGPSMA